jgi:hypothetical protein
VPASRTKLSKVSVRRFSSCCSGALRAPELLENPVPAVRDRHYRNQTDSLPAAMGMLEAQSKVLRLSNPRGVLASEVSVRRSQTPKNGVCGSPRMNSPPRELTALSPGERVARSGAFISRSVTGEGSRKACRPRLRKDRRAIGEGWPIDVDILTS